MHNKKKSLKFFYSTLVYPTRLEKEGLTGKRWELMMKYKEFDMIRWDGQQVADEHLLFILDGVTIACNLYLSGLDSEEDMVPSKEQELYVYVLTPIVKTRSTSVI